MSGVRSKLKVLLWIALGTAGVVLLLRTFVGDVYVVEHVSMMPALEPGELVLVLYDRDPPERADVVAVKRRSNGGVRGVVKRVGGLPRETVLIDPAGDLLVDGGKLGPDERHPPPAVLFDGERQRADEHFRMGNDRRSPWRETEGGWELDARGVEAGSAFGLMGLHKGLHTGWIGRSGEVEYGPMGRSARDAVVECSFRALTPGGVLRLVLEDSPDTVQFVLDLADPARARGRITRNPAGNLRDTEVIAEGEFSLTPGQWTAIRFSNVDDHVRVDLGSPAITLSAPCPPRPPGSTPLVPDGPRPAGGGHERVKLGGEGCHLELRGIRVSRDVHYTRAGRHAVGEPLVLGPGEYFVLGDNSRESEDSRHFGPVTTEDLVGEVRWVVWPPSHIRVVR